MFNLVAGPRRADGRRPDRAGLASGSAVPRPSSCAPGEPTALRDGEVYVPYFDMQVVFDDSRARALLGPEGIRAPLLADYFSTLIDYAETARWGKRALTREEVRERVAAAAAA